MSAYANSVQKPERFDMYVRKFRSICSMHGVQVGSRTDLPGFMQKLMGDRHLAMDFWAFTGKLSNREGGELSDDQMVALVLEGVVGDEVAQQDDEQQRKIVDNLRAMLAGVDVQGHEQIQIDLAPFPRNEADPRPMFASETVDNDVDQPVTSPSALSPQLDEALLRLEETTHRRYRQKNKQAGASS